MKLNEKGFTLIELLMSMLILVAITTATLQFYESYNYEKSEFGEYITAKNLAVKALEEQRDILTSGTGFEQPIVYQNTQRVNGVSFSVEVTKEDKTPEAAVLTDEKGFVKLTSKVKWKLRKLEVSTYVSER